jgi:hypothetical protein
VTQLTYSRAELFTEHDYAEFQIVDGRRLHGGFLADGTYRPPRSLGRSGALDAWTTSLRSRGGDLLDADSSLLDGVVMPNVDQHRLLLGEGLGRTFWNMLTITGKIEARGRLLAEIDFPELQEVVVEDISGMAIGHLNKGLLVAHGFDEGGTPAEGIGGHDEMWFIARDLAFGADAFEDVAPPENIGRPDTGERTLPEISPEAEGLLSLLMNLLIIEFRAEIGFALTQDVLRTPGLFEGRATQVAEADEIVGRIRADEVVHISSLQLYLGELKTVSLATVAGGTIPGAELVERMWAGLVHWATVERPLIAAAQQREVIAEMLHETTEGQRILARFDELSDLTHLAAGAETGTL